MKSSRELGDGDSGDDNNSGDGGRESSRSFGSRSDSPWRTDGEMDGGGAGKAGGIGIFDCGTWIDATGKGLISTCRNSKCQMAERVTVQSVRKGEKIKVSMHMAMPGLITL